MTNINKISIFNNHFKGSNDLFRQFFGLYTDIKDDNLIEHSEPKKILNSFSDIQHSYFSECIDEENLKFKRQVVVKISNNVLTKNFFELEYNNSGITNKDALFDFLNSKKEFQDFCFQYNKNINKSKDSIENWADIEQEYNFYIKQYEEKAANIPEELLPNYYVFSLALNKNILNNIQQSNIGDSFKDFDKKFDQLITLDDNINFNNDTQLENLSEYYKQYSEKYDNVSVDILQTYKNQFGNVVTTFKDQETYDILNNNKSFFPMSIELKFSKEEKNQFFDLLKELNFEYDSFSSFIKDKVFTSDDKFLQTFWQTSLKVFNDNSSLDYFTSNHFQQDFDRWFKQYIQNDSQNVSIQQDVNLNQNFSYVGASAIEVETRVNNQSDLFDYLVKTNVNYKYRDILINNFRNFKDIINGKLSNSDVIFFRIEKRDKITNNFIQNIYIPNIPNIDVMSYIDTQVKYGKQYSYKIYATNLVYGTKYSYSLKDSKNSIYFNPQDRKVLRDVRDVSALITAEQENNNQFESFKSVSEALKVNSLINQSFYNNDITFNDGAVLVPVDEDVPMSGESSEESFTNLIPRRSNQFTFQQEEEETDFTQQPDRDDDTQGGIPNPPFEPIQPPEIEIKDESDMEIVFDVIYQPIIRLVECEYTDELTIKILDFPPTIPDISFYPILESNGMFNICIQDSYYEYEDYFIPILESDYEKLNLGLIDPRTGFIGEPQKIKFKGDGDTKEFEVFRTDIKPRSYRDFNLYKTVKFPDESTILESIEPNKKYWYTFRTKDIHNNISNPTIIYEVEIYNDQLLFIPSFNVFEFEKEELLTEKSFKKYIKISPNLIHKIWNEQNNRLGLGPVSVFDKEFMMKIKSKQTGRVMHVYFKFKIDKDKIN